MPQRHAPEIRHGTHIHLWEVYMPLLPAGLSPFSSSKESEIVRVLAGSVPFWPGWWQPSGSVPTKLLAQRRARSNQSLEQVQAVLKAQFHFWRWALPQLLRPAHSLQMQKKKVAVLCRKDPWCGPITSHHVMQIAKREEEQSHKILQLTVDIPPKSRCEISRPALIARMFPASYLIARGENGWLKFLTYTIYWSPENKWLRWRWFGPSKRLGSAV